MAEAEDSIKQRKTHLQPGSSFLPPEKSRRRFHAPKFQSAFDPHPSTASTNSTQKPPSFPPGPPPAQQSESDNAHGTSSRPIRQPTSVRDSRCVKSTIPMKRRRPPEALTVFRRPATTVKPLSTSSRFLKEPHVFPGPPTKPLQRRRAPPIPELPSTIDNNKEMKPLSTTHFASLVDASFDEDDDSVDLSALPFRLQEHKARIQPNEHKSDVLISPQKNKHVRGGLASRAAQLYKQSHISLYLWRIAMENPSLPQTPPDFSFRVGKIVHTTLTGSYKPYIYITLGRILTLVRPFTSRKQLVYILLKLPDVCNSSPLCNPENLQEGITLQIWRPWHEVALIHLLPGTSLDMPSASLPLPSSNDSSSVSFDAENTHNTILLCSRFLITQDST